MRSYTWTKGSMIDSILIMIITVFGFLAVFFGTLLAARWL